MPKSFIVAPSSRFSKRAHTGTRVVLNTQAPLTFPGTRSTDERGVQSNIARNTMGGGKSMPFLPFALA